MSADAACITYMMCMMQQMYYKQILTIVDWSNTIYEYIYEYNCIRRALENVKTKKSHNVHPCMYLYIDYKHTYNGIKYDTV